MSSLVSVVLPVYNGEKFLAEAVESILKQTYAEFELLAIDDGSTDSSAEILSGFQQRDSRVQIIKQPRNMGLIAALNAGCQRATGEFIARMDADDICYPQRLEKQVAYLKAHPNVGVIGTALQHIDAEGKMGAVATLPLLPGHLRWCMIFGNYLPHPSAMMRRDTLAQVGFYSEAAYRIEDYDLWTRMLELADIANLPDALLKYRSHSQSSMVGSKPPVEIRATQIVKANVERLLSQKIDIEAVRWLRAVDNPGDGENPNTEAAQAQTEKLIDALYEAYCQAHHLQPEEIQAIRHDIAHKLLVLARLLLRVSPFRCLRLMGRSFRWSPPVILDAVSAFSRKISRKFQSTVGQR